jgi:hypothetical protein
MAALRRIGLWLAPLATALALLAAPVAASELRLLMVDRLGCEWCAAWDREVGPVYARTEAGARAPLMRTRLGQPLPEGVALDRPVRYTPTFALLRDGVEIGRIDGYPGEDFFWGLLEAMLEREAAGGS